MAVTIDKAKGLKIGTMYKYDKSARIFTQAIVDTESGKVNANIEESKWCYLFVSVRES